METTHSSAAGFSLIEMLVVLFIVSSATALIATSWPVTASAPSLQRMGRTLAASMRRARTLAIATRARVDLTIDVEQKSYWIKGPRSKKIVLPKIIAITITTARSKVVDKVAAIGFFPDGTSSGGQIELRHQHRTVRIAVDWRTGAAHVSSRN